MEKKRMVVHRSPHRRVGLIHCPWLQSEPIEYESLLERDFVRVMLLTPGLVSISSQPFTLTLPDAGCYTPDYLLTFTRARRLVIEVKPSERLNTKRNQTQLPVAAKVLNESGYEFYVATESCITASDRHVRAALLLRQARGHFPSELIQRATSAAIECGGQLTLRQLMEVASVSFELVMHLIGRGKLRLSPSLDYSLNQVITLNGSEKEDGNLHPATWLGHSNWPAPFGIPASTGEQQGSIRRLTNWNNQDDIDQCFSDEDFEE